MAGAVSLEPPLVAMAIHPSCYSHDLLRRGGEAVLNIPPRPLAETLCVVGTSRVPTRTSWRAPI
jgi:flavin reductase (DIM6/NTAB) family NADH-FMN oxidoreductase RutF